MLRGFLSMPKTQNKTRKNPYNLRSSASSSDVMENRNSTIAPPHAGASVEVTSDSGGDHLQPPFTTTKTTLGGGGPTVNASTFVGVAGSTTTLPPMPPPPPTTVGGSQPSATMVTPAQQVPGSAPSSLERMQLFYNQIVQEPPRTTVTGGGGGGDDTPSSGDNEQVEIHGDMIKVPETDYGPNSPKDGHTPNSYANLFKEAANILKTGKLRFIPPVYTEIGTKHAVIPDELLTKQNEKWLLTLVGSFVGKRPAFPFVKFHAFRLWKQYGLVDVILNNHGRFYFKFDNDDGLQFVLKNRPWLFNDIPVLLKKWKVGIEYDIIRPTDVPLWVNIYDLSPIMWNFDILSHIVSVIGVPIAVDRYTEGMCEKQSGRALFARVLVKINADRDIPAFAEALVLGKMEKFRLQYYWKPDRCSHCAVFGHKFIDCADRPKSAEEMEATIPSVASTNEVGPSGTKKQDFQGNQGDQDFQEPKRRRRRPKKAQTAGAIQIPKPKFQFIPKKPADPKGKAKVTTPETSAPSDTSQPVRVQPVDVPTQDTHSGTNAPAHQDIPSTVNQFDVLSALNTDDVCIPSAPSIHEDIDINSVPTIDVVDPDHQSAQTTTIPEIRTTPDDPDDVNSAPAIDAAADHQSTTTNVFPTDSTIFEIRTTPDDPGTDSASLREEVDATKVVGGFFGLDLNDHDEEIEDLIRSGY